VSYVPSFPCASSTPAGLSGLRPPMKTTYGLGCGDGPCTCGCSAGSPAWGMAGLTFDGTGLFGSGLFSGGLDFSTWGPGEFGVAALGAWMIYSTFFTTRAAVGQARRKVRAFHQTR
jgi:hypothetical protein